MPRRRSSIKRKRADKKRHLSNLRIKNQIRNIIKKLKGSLEEKNFAQAKSQLDKAFSSLDKAAKKKVIHKNLASRRKSKLSMMLLKATQADQKPL